MLLPIRRPFADPGVKTTTRYNNGGSLEELIQKYRRLGQHVPETFIWHVTVELGKALMYLWQGPRNDVVPWVSIRHRALTAENVFVNYESTKSGARFANGTPRNAFPQIVLGNFSRAARRDDPAADLLPSAMMEAYMNYSDYGVLLRRLAQAHIPEDEAPEQVAMRDACFHGLRLCQPARYSQELVDWLSGNFEYPNMRTSDIFQIQTVNNVPSPNYVSPLRNSPLLAYNAKSARRWGVGATSFTSTTPTRPPPDQQLHGARRRVVDQAVRAHALRLLQRGRPAAGGLDRWSVALGSRQPLRPHRELRWMEWVFPKLYPVDVRTDVSKQRGAGRPRRFYVEPGPVAAAAANGGGGGGGSGGGGGGGGNGGGGNDGDGGDDNSDSEDDENDENGDDTEDEEDSEDDVDMEVDEDDEDEEDEDDTKDEGDVQMGELVMW
ncbi:hypothetical protein PG996_003280 [Apiospora saccharicola]|uniref:Protein kinase domain-containing protein n=1 Tax=Apiospora saccharicola TaxID=335842 RepID=A0ABR1W0S9_9PEZI